ncbi:MAG TPA: PD40 domain-containing protein [Synechococcales cyanobacterium M55_K2018_004]|nr:PD40 domain-containing protein [Synechococcales cyanobacterium M55_K2018_004]
MSRDALVVGINSYQYLQGLQAPAQDAEAIAQVLQNCGEFRVQRLPEVVQAGKPQVGKKTMVTLRDLETALINLFKPKGNNIPQTALFYFSGHGIQREAGICEGYLAVSDSQPEVGFFGLSLFWLRRLLQESPVRQRIVILDCCHSGELLNFMEADPGARPGTDRLFMAASREYEAAYESLNSEYSVFTQSLLEALNPDQCESGMVTSLTLTARISDALQGELQQPLFEHSGGEIILTRQKRQKPAALSPRKSAQSKSDICPYRGLEPFEEEHAEFFFGRDDVTAQLLDKLRNGKSATVLGASGSGKTSVIRAGLVAALRRGQRLPGSDRWRVKIITPTAHPLRSLASAFIDPELNDLAKAEQLQRAEQFLQEGTGGLSRLVRASLAAEPVVSSGLTEHPRPRMVLIIDQLEEAFTLCTQAEERQMFFDCLTQALKEAEDCLAVVLALRSDFFHKCLHYRNLAQLITQRMVLLKPLSYDQIKETIVRPARKVGLVCEPNLVYTMLLDIIGAPGELALLQYTLMELWQQRQIDPNGGPPCLTLNAYTELGGIRGTLQKRANETYESLSPEEQQAAKRIFLALTQLGEGTEDTRRRVTKSELVTPAFPADLVEQTLEKLIAAKLIVTSREGDRTVDEENVLPKITTPAQDQGQEAIDVAHEALIRNWPRLRNWLEENRDMLRRQRRIEQSAQEWDRANQPMNGVYLLQELRLRDAEDFLKTYPQELSALAQQFVAVSHAEVRRRRRQSQQRRVIVPSALVLTLAMTLSQHRSILQNVAQKDHQLLAATSREQAAIAQSLLKESQRNATTALLISRLAAERGSRTFEAQESLRAALQDLRLQSTLQGHRAPVQQIVFSPDQQTMATAGADGSIRLWAVHPQQMYATGSQPALRVLHWSSDATQPSGAVIHQLAFSADGKRLAAIAQNQAAIKVWEVESGALLWQLQLPEAARRLAFSPDGKWVAVSSDRTLSVWQAETGQFQAHLARPALIRSLEFNPNGQALMVAGDDGVVQMWQLNLAAGQPLQLHPTLTLSHPAAIRHATFSPSGRWLATGGADGKTYLWETATGQLRQTLQAASSAPTEITGAPLTAPVTTAAMPSAPMMVERMFANPLVNPIQQVQFSPDETLVTAVSAQHQVWLWDLRSGQLQAEIKAPELAASSNTDQTPSRCTSVCLSFHPNSSQIAIAYPNGLKPAIATLWNTQTGQQIHAFGDGLAAATAVQFSPDGRSVVTATPDNGVQLWRTEPGGELPTITLPETLVQWAAFLPTTQPTTGVTKTALAQPPSAQPATSLPHLAWFGSPSAQPVAQLSAPPLAQTYDLVTVSGQGKLRHWSVLDQPMMADPTSHSEVQTAHAQTRPGLPSGANPHLHLSQIDPQALWQGVLGLLPGQEPATHSTIAVSMSASLNRLGRLQQLQALPEIEFRGTVQSPSQFSPQTTGQAGMTGFALSADGQFTATASAEGWVEIRQVQPDQSVRILHRLQNSATLEAAVHRQVRIPVRHLAFSPDGQWLLGVSDDLTVRVWETQSGRLLQNLKGHLAPIRHAEFSPDGQHILTASLDKTAIVWDVQSARPTLTLPHGDRVSHASFSRDGKQIATGSWDGTAQIFDATTGQSIHTLQGHRGSVLDVQFSPDGRLLVTASVDGTARLWDAATGELQAELRPDTKHPTLMRRAFFSPDGQYVATVTDTGQVFLWAATWDSLLKIARDRSLRQLTPEECTTYLRLAAEACPQMELGVGN